MGEDAVNGKPTNFQSKRSQYSTQVIKLIFKYLTPMYNNKYLLHKRQPRCCLVSDSLRIALSVQSFLDGTPISRDLVFGDYTLGTDNAR